MVALGCGGLVIARTVPLAVASIVLLGLGYGAAYISIPVVFGYFFGRRAFAGTSGLRIAILAISGWLGPRWAGAAADASGSYIGDLRGARAGVRGRRRGDPDLPRAGPRVAGRSYRSHCSTRKWSADGLSPSISLRTSRKLLAVEEMATVAEERSDHDAARRPGVDLLRAAASARTAGTSRRGSSPTPPRPGTSTS